MQDCIGIIIENDKGELLLQLRDDDAREFPNQWVCLGGAMDSREKPEDAVRREIKEEIGLDIGDFEYFRNFNYNNRFNQFFFYKKMNVEPRKIKLNEGKEIRFFSKREIKQLDIGFNIRDVLNEFISKREKNG